MSTTTKSTKSPKSTPVAPTTPETGEYVRTDKAALRSIRLTAEEGLFAAREMLFQLAECLPEHIGIVAYAARSGAEDEPVAAARDTILSALADLSKVTHALSSIAIDATPKAAEVTA